MRKDHDEYQKYKRYKYGYHAFIILVILLVSNNLLPIQWGQTEALETTLLIFAAGAYFLVMSVYHNAYFRKLENPVFYSILFLFLGILNISTSFSEYTPIVENGILTKHVITLAAGMMWLTVPITYGIRRLVEKKQNRRNT